MTHVKISKFDFDRLQKNSQRYELIWKYATEISLKLPNNQRVKLITNMDQTDSLIDRLLLKQPNSEVNYEEL
jgi:hypothetical protein